MTWLPLLLALATGSGEARGDAGTETDAERREQLEQARRRLREAMEKRDEPTPAETAKGRTNVGQKVDKYFGTRLPPVCERLGCYLTDDGRRYYCVNPGCQKHKKRATKHSRVKRVRKKEEVFFRCPKCLGRNVEVLLLVGEYHCNDCQHRWPREPPGEAPPDAPEPGLGEPTDRRRGRPTS